MLVIDRRITINYIDIVQKGGWLTYHLCPQSHAQTDGMNPSEPIELNQLLGMLVWFSTIA